MKVTLESFSTVSIAVYEGDCAALACVEPSDESLSGAPTVFEAESDKEYFIYAFGERVDFNITLEGTSRHWRAVPSLPRYHPHRH